MNSRAAFALPRAPLAGSFTTVGEALAAAGEQFGDREAVVMPGAAPLTFAGWYESSRRLAGHLRRIGVVPGDVVALTVRPGNDYAIAYGAAALLGAISTGINPRLGVREIEFILDRCRPKVVIGEECAHAHPADSTATVLTERELRDALAGPPLAGPSHAGAASDPVAIVWTSGTTGTPKGAWFDHANLAAVARMSGVVSAPFDRRIQANSWALAAYMTKLWDQLAWGITLVGITLPWNPAEYLEIVRRERVTVLAAVPTQWEKLIETYDGAPLPAVRLGMTSAAPISPELVRKVIATMGIPLVCRYASTESPLATGTSPRDSAEVLAETLGKPQADVELRVVGADGKQVPDGTVGTVQLRSEAVMRGYWGEPELTAEVLAADRWLTTGDSGRIDPQGNLVLAGRRTDMYIRGGYNVYPAEVEAVLAGHPAVGRVAVVGAETPVIGELGVAFVVPEAGATAPTLAELRQWCGTKLADYKCPDRVHIVEDLPLTAAMKVDKRALRRLAGTANDSEAPAADPLVEAVARERRARLDEGRPEAVAKQHQRGELTARERVARLVDPESFVEYGLFAEAGDPGLSVPADGVVTGVGSVAGHPVAVMSYDYTAMGGSQGHVGHHKVDRLLGLTAARRWPLVVITEGGGARAQEVGGQYNVGGRITTFKGLAELSGKVPTVAVVPGRCFAGSANVAAFADCIIATERATLGLAGPPLVQAATGQLLSPEQIGPASLHAKAGNLDVVRADEVEALEAARTYLLRFLEPVAAARPSHAARDEIRGIVPDNPRKPYDMREVLRCLCDADGVLELRSGFAQSVITALCRLEGRTVGIVASQPKVRAGALDTASADKMARFIQLCGAFGIPIVFLVDTPGNMVGPDAEATALLRHSARPALALAHAGVPFITVVLRKAYGLAQFCMGSRMMGPLLHVVWPTAEFGEMGMQGAANILKSSRTSDAQQPDAAKLGESYIPKSYAAQFRTDDIIDPADTRDIIARSLQHAATTRDEASAPDRWVDTW
ncbi:MAG TPA: carboxyl transferase domain-containing protein [Amycolatopsis sp.]|nr:carboxyl transferase domain-containing protein [Amycolatopsis sp.]